MADEAGKKGKNTTCLQAIYHRNQTLIIYINRDTDEERLVINITHTVMDFNLWMSMLELMAYLLCL